MPGLQIGYARVSTDQQDLTAQRDALQFHRDGEHTVGQLAELFSVARSTVSRAIQRREAASSVALEPVAV